VQNRSKHLSPKIRANIIIAEFDFEKRFLKKSYLTLVQKVKILNLLVSKFQIYENICDNHHSSVLWSLDMQSNKHAVVLRRALGLSARAEYSYDKIM